MHRRSLGCLASCVAFPFFTLAACASPPAPPRASLPSPPIATAPAATTARAIGFRTIEGVDPWTKQPLPLGVMYPSSAPVGPHATLDLYDIAATRDAALDPGVHPLIALSHGHAGSLWGHHDLAEALASHGYIVVMVEHVGDSWRDQSGAHDERYLYGRAYQVSAAIDRVLADPALSPHVDPKRIGVAGFSAGGYTSLLLLGAEPELGRLIAYCGRHPENHDICAGPIPSTAPPPARPMKDARIRAGFVMAPFAVMLTEPSVKSITAPVFLAWGTQDRLLVPADNAEAVAKLVPALAGTRALDGAGHYVFVAPCSAELLRRLPEICTDPPGVDRVAIHARLDDDAVRFFDAKLR